MIDPVSLIGLGLTVKCLYDMTLPKKTPEKIEVQMAESFVEDTEGWEDVEDSPETKEVLHLSTLANWSDPDSEGWSELID